MPMEPAFAFSMGLAWVRGLVSVRPYPSMRTSLPMSRSNSSLTATGSGAALVRQALREVMSQAFAVSLARRATNIVGTPKKRVARYCSMTLATLSARKRRITIRVAPP